MEAELEVEIERIDYLVGKWVEQKKIILGAQELARGYATQLSELLKLRAGEGKRVVCSHGDVTVKSPLNRKVDADTMTQLIKDNPILAEYVSQSYRVKEAMYGAANIETLKLLDTAIESKGGQAQVTLK